MANKMAFVIWDKCDPEQCSNGICQAAKACTRKVLKQEAPHEAPMMDAILCRACSDCARACPLKAIKIMNI